MTLPAVTTEWLSRLGQIPDAHRRFDVDLKRAEAEFGIVVAQVHELVARGMSHEMREGVPWLAQVDLHYVGLRMGTAGPYLAAMQQWARRLSQTTAGAWPVVDIRYVAFAPPGSSLQVLVPPGRLVQTTTAEDRTALHVEVSSRSDWPGFDSRMGEILEEVGALELCLVPTSLEKDSEFTRRTGIASCASSMWLILEECARLGVQARPAYGLVLGPLAAPRQWAEICVDDVWVPADPLLVEALKEFADLDAIEWPATRSPGALLLRLAAERTAIVSADGRDVAASYVTTPVADPASRG